MRLGLAPTNPHQQRNQEIAPGAPLPALGSRDNTQAEL